MKMLLFEMKISREHSSLLPVQEQGSCICADESTNHRVIHVGSPGIPIKQYSCL